MTAVPEAKDAKYGRAAYSVKTRIRHETNNITQV